MDLKRKLGIFLGILALIFWKYTLVLIGLLLFLALFCLVATVGAIVLGIVLFAFCAVIFAGAMAIIGGKFAFTEFMWLACLYSEEWENGPRPPSDPSHPATGASRTKKKTAYPLWRKDTDEKRMVRRVLADQRKKT